MTKRVLALQHIWDDPPGYLGEVMQENNIAFDTFKVNEEPNLFQIFDTLNQYAAIISLGGPQHAADDEQYPYLAEEKVLIRQIVEKNIPYLGVCLGGQLLAHALGAEVKRHTLTEIGFYEVQLTSAGESDPLFDGLPPDHLVFQWHMDVFDLPSDAVKLETSASTPNQVFRLGPSAYALQYHIELTASMFDTWLRLPDFKREIINTIGSDALEAIETRRNTDYPLYREQSYKMFTNFLKISNLL